MANSEQTPEFHFLWRQITPEWQARILRFWNDEQAIPQEIARSRLREVIGALTIKDNLVAICSASVNRQAPIVGQPMYIFRTFVAAQYRRQGHARRLLNDTFDAFQRDINQRREAASPDDPPPKSPLGIMLIIPTELTDVLDDHFIWPDTQFSLIGYASGGEHYRIRYFDGLELYPPYPQPNRQITS
ncbi:MAG: GNAT family N-acetyltransferase [Pseudomonadota bacterium]